MPVGITWNTRFPAVVNVPPPVLPPPCLLQRTDWLTGSQATSRLPVRLGPMTGGSGFLVAAFGGADGAAAACAAAVATSPPVSEFAAPPRPPLPPRPPPGAPK